MKTLAELYANYGSYNWPGTDKGTVHSYIEVYEFFLAPYRLKPGAIILEIGIMGGASLKMWEQYFHNGTVYGVDLCDQPLGMVDLRPMITEGTHHIVLMNAVDPVQVEKHFSGIKFDVIIEDASHTLSDQRAIYRNFKNRMAPGGLYVIEDIDKIDEVRPVIEQIDPSKRVRVIDRRHVKNRFDDVMAVIEGYE